MRVVELSGGVGGARLARGLAALDDVECAIVVNVGDDMTLHGLHISPDLDTVTYTLAGLEGAQGWGRAGDTFVTNEELARFGMDNRFQLGDLDLALHLFRSERLRAGESLTSVTAAVAHRFGIEARLLPVSDDPIRTMVTTRRGERLSFVDYFVYRGHRDHVAAVDFAGAAEAHPGPAVVETISAADLVVIGPSNPPLSIWPILAVPAVEEAVRAHPKVVAVSPLIRGRALKGPAAAVLADLGHPPGHSGVVASYRGLVDVLVVHLTDEPPNPVVDGVEVVAMDTLIAEPSRAAQLAKALLAL